MLNQNMEEKAGILVERIDELIQSFRYREGPDLYFYRKTISLRRHQPLEELFQADDDRYIELIYATLVSWDMNSRRAKMKYFDEFRSTILDNEQGFLELSTDVLDALAAREFMHAKRRCGIIYSNLHAMKTSGRLVSNSKIMHFILPDLVMPMDGGNTLKFFYGNAAGYKKRFLEILECSYNIAREVDLRQFLDEEWNLSITKVIDNAIISHMSPKYRKESR